MLQPSTQDLNKLIEGMEVLLKRTLGASIDYGVFLQHDNWHALVDQSQMESVLLNMVLNAGDAMIDGGQLIIRTENVLLENNTDASEDEVLAGAYVMVSVSDSGTGMSAKVTDKVFEPFFTTKEIGKGSGLGLSMIHGFVKQSGGHTVLESQVGEGTTVKLYLPRSKTDEGRAETSAASSEFDGHGMILVVEDSTEVRRITVRILHRLGYQTLEAEDGKMAMQYLEGGKEIDLLLTDVVLPGDMSGILIAQEAQKAKRPFKVLYMSGLCRYGNCR